MQEEPSKKTVFENEIQILNDSREILKNGSVSDFSEAYRRITQAYASLLNDVKLLTSVSDRLQRKHNQANQKLREINEELIQQTEEIRAIHEALQTKNAEITARIQELKAAKNDLTLAKIRRKATSIIVIVAIVLLILTEIFDRFVMEGTSWASKVILIIIIKPLDNFIMERLKRRELTQSNLSPPSAA
ncbi:MAG: hypothetical protein NZ455_04980 [Bacteroidia bacterium]|nr:hypothetical protein [Bacteroidia bacterium]MDW8345751.1 hypothetical protein [Bacteroidia bacterium]